MSSPLTWCASCYYTINNEWICIFSGITKERNYTFCITFNGYLTKRLSSAKQQVYRVNSDTLISAIFSENSFATNMCAQCTKLLAVTHIPVEHADACAAKSERQKRKSIRHKSACCFQNSITLMDKWSLKYPLYWCQEKSHLFALNGI